jgi:hypothetical protein
MLQTPDFDPSSQTQIFSNPDASRDAQNCWSFAVYQRSVYQRLCDRQVCHELIFVIDEFLRISLHEMELFNTERAQTLTEYM